MSMKLTLSRFEDRLNVLQSRQSSLEELVNSNLRSQNIQSVTDSGLSSCEDGAHAGLTIPTTRNKQYNGEHMKATGVMKASDVSLLNNISRSVKYVETSLKIACQINSSKHGFSTELESLQTNLKSHLKYLQHEQAKITMTQGTVDTKTNRKPNTNFKVPSHTFEHLRGSVNDTETTFQSDAKPRPRDTPRPRGTPRSRGTPRPRGVLAGGNGYRRRGEDSYNNPGGGGRTASKGRYEDHSTSP